MGQAVRLASNFVVLDDDTIRMTEPGAFAIVHRNTWHTARIRETSIMMFLTPGEGTINAAEPPRE